MKQKSYIRREKRHETKAIYKKGREKWHKTKAQGWGQTVRGPITTSKGGPTTRKSWGPHNKNLSGALTCLQTILI